MPMYLRYVVTKVATPFCCVERGVGGHREGGGHLSRYRRGGRTGMGMGMGIGTTKEREFIASVVVVPHRYESC